MAWIYLAESEESQKPWKITSDQSPIVRTIGIASPCSCRTWHPEHCHLHQFGMIYEHSNPVADGLSSKSSTAGSLAKIFQSAITAAKAWKESEAAFLKRSCGLLMRWNPPSSSWRTCQQFLFEDLEKLPEVLPLEGMTCDGLLYQLTRSELRTFEKDGGALPTPQSRMGGWNKSTGKNAKKRPTLETMARRNLWPTPQCHNYTQPGKGSRANGGRKSDLAAEVGGKLNPTWVEWLMGYPCGWTELKPWAIQWFRNRRKRLLST